MKISLSSTDNKNDSLAIKLGVSKNDPLYDEKVTLLSSLGLPSSGSFMLIPGPHPISPGLLAFTRVFSMDKGKNKFDCLVSRYGIFAFT